MVPRVARSATDARTMRSPGAPRLQGPVQRRAEKATPADRSQQQCGYRQLLVCPSMRKVTERGIAPALYTAVSCAVQATTHLRSARSPRLRRGPASTAEMEDVANVALPRWRSAPSSPAASSLLATRRSASTAFSAHAPPGKGPESPLVSACSGRCGSACSTLPLCAASARAASYSSWAPRHPLAPAPTSALLSLLRAGQVPHRWRRDDHLRARRCVPLALVQPCGAANAATAWRRTGILHGPLPCPLTFPPSRCVPPAPTHRPSLQAATSLSS